MRKIDKIFVHCTATPQDATIGSIQSYWKNVLKWKNPGYHKIVFPDGNIYVLASDYAICNGVAGHNSTSLHVSYVGGIDSKGNGVDNRTEAQKKALKTILEDWGKKYPNAYILGHRDISPDKNKNGKIEPFEYIKMCPSFNAIPEYLYITKKEYKPKS